MELNNINQVFEFLKVDHKPKLGGKTMAADAQAIAYQQRREEIQKLLVKAASLRESTIKSLNIAFYIVIMIVITGTIFQIVQKGSDMITIVQAACSVALFPIASLIEKNVTKQVQIQFTAAFLPDLQPEDAIKAISALYQSLNYPDNVKKSLQKAK